MKINSQILVRLTLLRTDSYSGTLKSFFTFMIIKIPSMLKIRKCSYEYLVHKILHAATNEPDKIND